MSAVPGVEDSHRPVPAPIPIAIVGGFLGAGKTSLLKHLLAADHGLRIAVLVNDFGEVNVDAALIVAVEGESTVSLANGCICCTIRDDLLAEVSRIASRDVPPDYIVIETSGVSDPFAVAGTFRLDRRQTSVRVDAIVAVLDADLESIPPDFRALARAQVESADIVVLNKTDLVTPAQCAAMRAFVEHAVPRARLVETTHGRVPVEMILGTDAFDADARADDTCEDTGHASHDHASHPHGATFDTWTWRSDRAFSFSALQRAIEHLPRDVYRAKGRVKLEIDPRERGVLQVTGRRGWLKLDGPWAPSEAPCTELVFIGRPGAVTTATLDAHFAAALAQADASGLDGYVVEDLRAFEVLFA